MNSYMMHMTLMCVRLVYIPRSNFKRKHSRYVIHQVLLTNEFEEMIPTAPSCWNFMTDSAE